jgi:hypothetical protein
MDDRSKSAEKEKRKKKHRNNRNTVTLPHCSSSFLSTPHFCRLSLIFPFTLIPLIRFRVAVFGIFLNYVMMLDDG